MFFWILFLAHVIGDFPLQTDAIFRLKQKFTWGVFPHVLICSAVNLVFLVPFLQHSITIAVLVFLFLVHTVLDKTKIVVSKKTSQDNFSQFILDQFFHLASVWIAALMLTHSIHIENYVLFGQLLNQMQLVTATAFVLVTFAGTPVLYYLMKNAYSKEFSQKFRNYPTLYNRFPGFVERALSLFGFLSGSWLLILFPAAFLPKLILDKRFPQKLRIFRFLVGLGFVAFCGMLVFVFG